MNVYYWEWVNLLCTAAWCWVHWQRHFISNKKIKTSDGLLICTWCAAELCSSEVAWKTNCRNVLFLTPQPAPLQAVVFMVYVRMCIKGKRHEFIFKVMKLISSTHQFTFYTSFIVSRKLVCKASAHILLNSDLLCRSPNYTTLSIWTLL